MADQTETLVDLFTLNASGRLQAQFYSSLACAAVEKELAEAQIGYKTTIVKSKKRGLVYVIELFEPLGPLKPLSPTEIARGAGD